VYYILNALAHYLPFPPRKNCSFVAVLLLSVLLGGFSHWVNADTEAEYQQRLEALAESIKALQSELKSAKNSKDQLQQSLQASEEDIATLSKKVTHIKEALAREKKQLAQLQSQRAELEQNKQAQQQQIINGIQQVYRLGQQSQLKLILNQENPEQISRLVKYHDYIIKAHQTDIAAYTQTITELTAIAQTIIASTEKLEESQRQLNQRQRELQSSQKERRNIMAKLTASLNQKGQQLANLTSDRQTLQDLLDQATNALANLSLPNNAQAFTDARGKLPIPTQGKILYQFGSPQFEGKLKRNGIFISNQLGAKVVSVHHGRVIFSDYLKGHGLLLIIDHGNGYMSLYGHNQTLLKDIGDWTDTGEAIATVGNSGGQQQTGLYFEIRHQGQPQNPQTWLARS
jgi:murein hydrolase activator